MTTKEIADKLAELCRKGDFEKAQKDLYAEDAISVEPHATPAFEKETKGLKNILEKGEKFNSMVEKMNSMDVSDPIIADNSFAFTMTMDVVMKDMGPMKMTELCIYEVKDGKVVKEQFVM